jgi:uncharacterized coiled-coil DUF342 family protein
MILWWANLSGAKMVPGAYKVSLNVNGETQTQSFKILADPRAEVTVAQMQEQYDFVSDINATVAKAHNTIKSIRKLNAKFDAFVKQYGKNEATKELVAKAKELKKQFSEIEKTLYQTKNRSVQDPLNYPIRLTNKLGHLNSLVTMDDFPPTEQDKAVKKELTQKINQELEKFNNLSSQEIEKFNASFNELKLNYLNIEK